MNILLVFERSKATLVQEVGCYHGYYYLIFNATLTCRKFRNLVINSNLSKPLGSLSIITCFETGMKCLDCNYNNYHKDKVEFYRISNMLKDDTSVLKGSETRVQTFPLWRIARVVISFFVVVEQI